MECIGRYFIYDEAIRKCEEFQEDFMTNGKSLYEVIRIIEGVPLFLEDHMRRLEKSAELSGVKLWLGHIEIENRLKRFISLNEINEGNIKLVFNFKSEDNIFLIYQLQHKYPSFEEYKNGVKTILFHGERTNPNAKIINYDFRKTVDLKIKEASAYEAILVDRDGNITEGSKSNIFMVGGGAVYTASIDDVLPGVTRGVIIEICNKENIQLIEEKIHFNRLSNMEGLFISGTSPKVLPINSVDNKKYNSSNNEIILQIMNGYNNIVKNYIFNHRSDNCKA